jgi:predicted nucleic acid-binding protein
MVCGIAPGDHDRVEGIEHVHKVVNIDQSPIGRNSRSNPATYVGFYDTIRDLFTQAPLSVERGYKPGRFSFNVKGGRCEECQGEGVITTQLYFMPDVEVTCGACKGARFNSETLEVTIRGKTIDDVLNMSIEEGVAFFAGEPAIHRKVDVLNALGLGYLTLPVGNDPVGRRGAARQDRDGAEPAAAGEAHGLHPRRANHGRLSAVVMQELAAGARTADAAREMQRGIFEPFERRQRVFAPSSAAFVESGRVLAAIAARDRWQLLDQKPSLLNDALIAASCRERGITLITRDGDFKRLAQFVKGFRYAAPWPPATRPGSFG